MGQSNLRRGELSHEEFAVPGGAGRLDHGESRIGHRKKKGELAISKGKRVAKMVRVASVRQL